LLDQLVRTRNRPQYPTQELLVRHLTSHFPATFRDAPWYSGQTVTTIRHMAAGIGTALVSTGIDCRGEDLWVVADSAVERQIAADERTVLPQRLMEEP